MLLGKTLDQHEMIVAVIRSLRRQVRQTTNPVMKIELSIVIRDIATELLTEIGREWFSYADFLFECGIIG